jgi:arginine deiminase
MSDETIALVQSPLGVQPPEMAVFMGADPPYDPGCAAEESARLRAALESFGVRTLAPSEVLAEVPRDALVDLALEATSVDDEQRLPAVRAALQQWSSPDLVPIVLNQPRLMLEESAELAEISPDSAYESYVIRPLFGLMFPRDHYVDLGGAVALGRLRRRDRAREVAVMDAVLRRLRDRPAEVTVTEPHHLEGGDLVSYGDVAVLNTGFRTSVATYELLRTPLESNFQNVLCVQDQLRRSSEFHLDHWFALGPGVALVSAERIDATTVASANGVAATVRVTLRQALEALDIAVVPVAAEPATEFAANILFLPDRSAVIVSEQCASWAESTLGRFGIDVMAVPFGEHHKQSGSIHCAVNMLRLHPARAESRAIARAVP